MVTNIEYPIPEWDVEAQRLYANEPRIELTPGQQLVFIGWFRRFTESGFAHDAGLLELRAAPMIRAPPICAGSTRRTVNTTPRPETSMGPRRSSRSSLGCQRASPRGPPMPGPGPLREPVDRAAAIELAR